MNLAGNMARIGIPYADLKDMNTFAQQHMRAHIGSFFEIAMQER
jgi:hypothetical protein